MKKALLAVLAGLVMATSAIAGEYIGLTAGNGTNTKNDQHSSIGTLSYGQTNGAWDFDGRFGMIRQARTATNDNFAEARVRYEWNTTSLGGLKPWVRGTIGDQIPSTAGQYMYWAVEPGVGFQFTPSFRADGSYRRGQAFAGSVTDDRRTWIAAATYAADKKNSFVGRYYSSTDTIKANTWELGYVRSF